MTHPSASGSPKTAAAAATATVPGVASPFFLWSVRSYFVVQIILILINLLNLIAPLGMLEFNQQHVAAMLPVSCFGLAAWAFPIIGIVFLALYRSLRFRPAVRTVALAWLIGFGARFLVGMIWTAVLFMTVFKHGAPGDVNAAMSSFIAESPTGYYLTLLFNQIANLIEFWIVLQAFRKLAGQHCNPPPAEPPPLPGDDESAAPSAWAPPARRESKP